MEFNELYYHIAPYIIIFLVFCLAVYSAVQEIKIVRLENKVVKLTSEIQTYDTLKLYLHEELNFTEEHMKTGLNGLYVGDYFLVWVKDREYSDIIRTCNHEYLHYQYRNEWEHFITD